MMKKLLEALKSKMSEDEPKKGLLIIGKEEDDGASEALESACEDILSAIKAESAKDLAVALKAAVDVCDSCDEEEEE